MYQFLCKTVSYCARAISPLNAKVDTRISLPAILLLAFFIHVYRAKYRKEKHYSSAGRRLFFYLFILKEFRKCRNNAMFASCPTAKLIYYSKFK